MTPVIARPRVSGRPALSRPPRTLGALVMVLGRALLWLAVAVVLLRGLTSTFASEKPTPLARAPHETAVPAWPDDAARAFAVEFASAYLTHSPADAPGSYGARLQAFASPQPVAELAPQFDERAPRQAVRSATVAGVARLDDRHALVTVAASLDGPVARRMLTVPIARDRGGGLAVDDLPSFTAAAPRAATDPSEPEPLLGAERGAIVAVLEPFLRAYLAGDSAALAYLVPPDTRVAAAAGRLELIELTSISAAAPAAPAGRTVLATLEARDARARVTYALRYRVRLVHRDRWYVAAINGTGSETG